MLELLQNASQGAVGAWLAYCLLRWRDKKNGRPYKWDCPNCIFHIESTDPTVTLQLAERHEMNGHEE